MAKQYVFHDDREAAALATGGPRLRVRRGRVRVRAGISAVSWMRRVRARTRAAGVKVGGAATRIATVAGRLVLVEGGAAARDVV